MHRLILLTALLCPALATAADCTLPATLDQRQFTNLSDPLYAPDNPNAGRMVQVSFAGNQYVLDILGTDLRIGGSYRYQRLAPHIAEIQMTEAHPAGPAHSTLRLTGLASPQGGVLSPRPTDPPPRPRAQTPAPSP
ncbi:hypothetical protein, partial [Stenotrophomonas maltophilia]|uniref:hypothetical protein n=1 Tax=Stenotrophomonas maltophilia TaxID=40324 RepID=UPI0021ADB073